MPCEPGEVTEAQKWDQIVEAIGKVILLLTEFPENGKSHRQLDGWVLWLSRPFLIPKILFLFLSLFDIFLEVSNENCLFALLLKGAVKIILLQYN